MNDNIIIELRERDSKPLDSSYGNFESQLSKPVNIRAGDTILLKSAFIDTVEQTSNQIILNEDITCELKYGIYINDLIPTFCQNLNPTTPNYPISYKTSTGATPSIGAGQDYQPCIPYKNLTPSGLSLSQVGSWEFKWIPDAFDKTTASFNFVVQYNDIQNRLQKETFFVPQFGPGSNLDTSTYILDLNGLVYVDGTLSVLSPLQNDFTNYNVINVGPIGVIPYIGGGVYRPYEFKVNFDIEKGSYNASEFSLLISKKLSSNYIDPTNPNSTVCGNPFIKTTNQFLQGKPYPDGSPGTITGDTLFIKNDFSNAFVFLATQPAGAINTFFIGASQIALEYNSDSQQFEFTYMHMPYYDSAEGNTMITKCFKNSVGNYLTVSSQGGIFFTEMSAVVKGTTKYFDLWAGILGFNVDAMTAKIDNYGSNLGRFGISGSLYDKLEPLVLSKNITNMYVGIDSIINKQANKWFYETDATFEGTADPNETTKITASTPLPVLLDTFSHYLIEIQAGFYNELVGQETYRTINGIISKYYGYSSYTFDGGEGAIEYVHKGNELQLKSIRVRILRSDKSRNMPGLGDDNTFYLQIIKAPPAKPAITN